ncbi:MAG: aldehyde dehydrogenase family protein [Streptomyces sp.]|uniref:aldehyde dehydrogenase family protein n=1 Tax=Streptomyces sp. TaxID=1931 RepID=UPI003456056C|nr:aldehyde dehydrogenase family protein [Streptomyces sp.]
MLNVVHGEGDVGAALCGHPLVRKVVFTGGTATGRKVVEAARGAKAMASVRFMSKGTAVCVPSRRTWQVAHPRRRRATHSPSNRYRTAVWVRCRTKASVSAAGAAKSGP